MTTVTEILELYRYVGDTEAAEVALTDLINESVAIWEKLNYQKSSHDI